jgi:alkanesulfonate monooxygenase SsuD/methylene tetrahydromethanopterin reductase-like flavin-dependent oxidoreductase (luciferase family)
VRKKMIELTDLTKIYGRGAERTVVLDRRRSERSGFVGTPGEVADEVARWVRSGATDGFNISPYIVPGGLDEIVNWPVPELQERGVYPPEYTSTTLRGHLGLREPLT